MWALNLINNVFHTATIERFIRNRIHACSNPSRLGDHVTFELIRNVLNDPRGVETRGALLTILNWASLDPERQGKQLILLLKQLDWQNLSNDFVSWVIEKESVVMRYPQLR